MGLFAKEPTLRLSHHRTEAIVGKKLISFNNDLIHKTSAAKFESDIYSDSVLDQATTCCLQEDHETKLSQKRHTILL